MKLKLVFENETRYIEFFKPTRLSELLTSAGEQIDMPCGGRGSCGKCRVRLIADALPMDAHEKTLLGASASEGIRLACMTTVTGDGEVYINFNKSNKIQLDGNLPAFDKDEKSGYGAAVDIGTTTVAAYLCDFESGRIISTSSAKNAQAAYGADVISRIDKALNGGLETLSVVIGRQIKDLLEKMCLSAGIRTEELETVVLTGNTTMQYLVCGLMPTTLAKAPFAADELFGKMFPANILGLDGGTKVYITRSISAFVGGDISSGILSTELAAYTAPAILADVGTNGEIVLADKGRLLSCSTAAGPAFEGAGIYMGMNAADGALSHVRIEEGEPSCEVIGGGKAVGLCGSGVIDAVAAFLELGCIDETGYINEESEYACEIDGITALRLPGTEVVLTQKDVRAVQLAKSAICSGIMTLISEAGLEPKDIGRLLIAGGFGTVLDVNSAEKIGLIPKGFAGKTVAVGNAAGMGAVEMLLAEGTRQTAEKLAERAVTVDLNRSTEFNELYIDNMAFGEI